MNTFGPCCTATRPRLTKSSFARPQLVGSNALRRVAHLPPAAIPRVVGRSRGRGVTRSLVGRWLMLSNTTGSVSSAVRHGSAVDGRGPANRGVNQLGADHPRFSDRTSSCRPSCRVSRPHRGGDRGSRACFGSPTHARPRRRWHLMYGVLRFGMLMRSPPDRAPEQPPRPRRDADTYLLAATIFLLVGFVTAVVIIGYARFNE